MDKHPIQSLMSTTMENIKDMVDVNTVVGDPVMTNDGTTIIPISRVSFGFLSGGGEFNSAMWSGGGSVGGSGSVSGSSGGAYIDGSSNGSRQFGGSEDLPFAGGTGAGVSVHPMGFLVVGNGQIKMLPTNYATPVDRVMELLPQVIGEIKDVFSDDGVSSASQSSSVTGKIPIESTKPIITEPFLSSSSSSGSGLGSSYEHRHGSLEKSGMSDKNERKWDNNHSSN